MPLRVLRILVVGLLAAGAGIGVGTFAPALAREEKSGAPVRAALAPEGVTREAGDDRIGTAVAVSETAFHDGAAHAVLATAGRYPDALASSALAGSRAGPVLLTRSGELDPRVRREIRRLEPEQVTVLGGRQAIAPAVVQQVRDLTRVRRVAGETRFETAAEVARALGDGGHAYVVEGQHPDGSRGWPDAVAVSALAAHEGDPVLLTTRDELPDATADAIADLTVDVVTVVGGRQAVSSGVVRSLESLGVRVRRLAGSTRYATSTTVASSSRQAGLATTSPWLVTGRDWPDALTAGPAAAHAGQALVLADGGDLDGSPATQRWLARTAPAGAILVGGQAALGRSIERDVRALTAMGDEPHELAAAGDIACGPDDPAWDSDEACRHADTAELAAEADSVLALGDLQYPAATLSLLRASYDPTWGRFKDRTYPAPGNHDYDDPQASGYHTYFGDRVGEPGAAYYDVELGDWHVISLDSNCAEHDGCEEGSEQERWLRSRLRQSSASCRLAFMHHPPFSSDSAHGSHPVLRPLLRVLYEEGVDVLLAGHAHSYERLRRTTPAGEAHPEQGVRSFVVGTGGVNLRPFGELHPLSVARNDARFGVLRLELGAGGYRWEFAPVGGGAGGASDAGFGSCR